MSQFSIRRRAESWLDDWKASTTRKPLLVRGARQVGKSFTIRSWATSRYEEENVLELNFEERPQLREIFSRDLVVERILDELQLATGRRVQRGVTLLFLDEIQASPEALTSLRYFYEKSPDLHVIAAGSLVEFVFNEVGIPVGRVENLFFPPITFFEFLDALGKNDFVQRLSLLPPWEPVPLFFHEELLTLMRLYFRIGGMPEAVSNYLEKRDLSAVSRVHEQLLMTFRDDFARYSGKAEWTALHSVFSKLAPTVGTTRIRYSRLDRDTHPSKVKAALSLLRYAGLIHFVTSTSAEKLPLAASSRPEFFKIFFLDIGLFQHLLGFDWQTIPGLTELTTIANGRLAEQFVAQEFIGNGSFSSRFDLYYWDREKHGAAAEVDFIIPHDGHPTPIEVKSGLRGTLRSLEQYRKEYNPSESFVLSHRNIEKMEKTLFLPMYLAARLVE